MEGLPKTIELTGGKSDNTLHERKIGILLKGTLFINNSSMTHVKRVSLILYVFLLGTNPL